MAPLVTWWVAFRERERIKRTRTFWPFANSFHTLQERTLSQWAYCCTYQQRMTGASTRKSNKQHTQNTKGTTSGQGQRGKRRPVTVKEQKEDISCLSSSGPLRWPVDTFTTFDLTLALLRKARMTFTFALMVGPVQKDSGHSLCVSSLSTSYRLTFTTSQLYFLSFYSEKRTKKLTSTSSDTVKGLSLTP